MFEVKLKKDVVINEQGTAEITAKMKIKNQSDKPQPLPPFSLREETSDVVDIRVRHGKSSIPYVKSVEKGFVIVNLDLQGITVDANKTYDIDFRYTVPSLIKRFDHAYFCKELFTNPTASLVETFEYAVTYELPELFSRKEFWKETYVNAPQASGIYTPWMRERKVIEYKFGLPKGSYREISFMFQERYNSKILALLTFLLGVGFIQFFDWLISLIF